MPRAASVDRLLSLTDVSVIAHRGGSALRPENTMLAFDHAASIGVDAFECDVHLSRDGEVVIIHDATLERTTDASGPVSARTAAELSRVDAGFRFGEPAGFPHRGQTGVPRLVDLLTRHPTMPVVIELKGEDRALVPRALDVIQSCGALDRVILGGFSLDVLREVRGQVPDVPTGAASLEVQAAMRRSLIWLAPRVTGYRLFQMPVRFRGRAVLTRGFVRAARRALCPVHAWVVDDPSEMRRLIDWGVTGIISDRPDVARELVRVPLIH